MKSLLMFTSMVLFGSATAFSQDGEIMAEGTVRDARTNKGVAAFIRYSSIPTGSINGRFNDSIFSFQIFGTAKYQVTVEAEGYTPKTVIVDPKDINENNKVEKEIRLTPSGETTRLDHLIFPQGRSEIDPESFPELDGIAQMLLENKNIVIQLEGHTDNVGSPEANLRLSQKRVDAVKDYLVKKGVSKKRIKTKAFGGTQPLRNEMTPEDRILNRRVEMRVLKQ